MVTEEDFLMLRLQSHLLSNHKKINDNSWLIQHYGCIQAQDKNQAQRCIASRLEWCTLSDITKAISNKEIVRSRPMRGTLHYVDPSCIHWILDLCASKTLSWFEKRREFLWISDQDAERSLAIIDTALRGWKTLTRSQLWYILQESWIPMQTQRLYHLTCYAATHKLICFWPKDGKEDSFVLLNEWIPKTHTITYDEQLAQLARMYIRSHGPCTSDDLHRRCGLWKTICKEAIRSILSELCTIEYNDKEYYYYDQWLTIDHNDIPWFLLLWWFDEYFLWYKDRSFIANREYINQYYTKNWIFFPLIVYNGKVVGTRNRQIKKSSIHVDVVIRDNSLSIKDNIWLEYNIQQYIRYLWFHSYTYHVTR